MTTERIYNSPPPVDLGTADPVASAARFGRTAAPGAAIRSYTGYGSPAIADGTVRTLEGRRVVQVAHGRPRYYSRDMLEDFDMFGDEPGYQYQWDGVEVEPTAEELAADRAEAEAKARKHAEAASAKARLDADQAALVARKDALVAEHGLVEQDAIAGLLRDATTEHLGRWCPPNRGISRCLDLDIYRDASGLVVGLSFGCPVDAGPRFWLAPALAEEARRRRRVWSWWTPEGYGARSYPGPGVPESELTDEERAEVARLRAARREADLAETIRRVRFHARLTLQKLGLIPLDDDDLKSRYGTRVERDLGVRLSSWDVLAGPEVGDYVAALGAGARDGDRPLEGIRLVLRVPASAFARAPRSRKPAAVESIPATIKLHAYCTAAVIVETAD